jgi:hypothetical protein
VAEVVTDNPNFSQTAGDSRVCVLRHGGWQRPVVVAKCGTLRERNHLLDS